MAMLQVPNVICNFKWWFMNVCNIKDHVANYTSFHSETWIGIDLSGLKVILEACL